MATLDDGWGWARTTAGWDTPRIGDRIILPGSDLLGAVIVEDVIRSDLDPTGGQVFWSSGSLRMSASTDGLILLAESDERSGYRCEHVGGGASWEVEGVSMRRHRVWEVKRGR